MSCGFAALGRRVDLVVDLRLVAKYVRFIVLVLFESARSAPQHVCPRVGANVSFRCAHARMSSCWNVHGRVV